MGFRYCVDEKSISSYLECSPNRFVMEAGQFGAMLGRRVENKLPSTTAEVPPDSPIICCAAPSSLYVRKVEQGAVEAVESTG